MKCWNVRDQTDETLRMTLARTYKEIEATYKQVRQAANIECLWSGLLRSSISCPHGFPKKGLCK